VSVRKATKRVWKLKSRILAWMLVVSMVVTLLPVQQATAAELPAQQAATAEPGFQDVRPTDWFYDAVDYVRKNGIFSGTGVGAFSPQGTMTRAMYVTALGRMAGVDVSEYSTSTFADVQSGIWYAPYVEWAAKKGITAGTGDRNFSPDATISREQMATLNLRYFESYQIPYQTSNRVTTKPGDLADVSPWAVDAVVKLWQAGLFVGDAKGHFNPRVQASRAEAAVLFMRNNEVVQTWQNQNPATPTPTPTPTPGPGGNGGNDSGGNISDSEYTITFDSNGGSAVAARTATEGEALSKLPAPVKEGYIFQGWFQDSDLSLIFAEGSAVYADTTLYAKYMDNVSKFVKSIPNYSVLDVAPGFTITVNDTTGGLTASEVQARMTFVDMANPDSAGIAVTGADGRFTVAAKGGQFVEGHTYQLTLTDDNLTFEGQDATMRIYVFSVAKQEVMKISLNSNMVYLPFADVTDMVLDGAEVNSPAIPIMTATVGDSEGNLAEANAGSGTFRYAGGAAIQVGDAVAIYEGVRPDLRTLETTGADNGDVAYVQITAVNGSTYTYNHADAKQVLSRPDILPVNVEADTDGEEDNGSITIEHTALNYSDSLYAELGLNELTTVDVGDFIAFYQGQFNVEGSKVVRYGRITSVTSAAEMDVITYTNATAEDIKHVFNIYQKQALDGDQLLSDEDIAKIEDQMERQAISSGFVDQAADYLSGLARQTKEFKALPHTKVMSPLGGGGKVSVENLTVVASLGTKLNNIAGQTSGVSATLQVGADIVIRIHEESDLVIHMTGTFLQEISLSLGIDGETEWGEACAWFICIPYPNDYRITANLDAYTFTGINVTAEIATVEHDKLEEALEDWDKAVTGGMLSKVRDIATEIQALIEGVQDTGMDEESLRAQYQEMMENDTDWVPLIKKELFEKSVRVVYGLIEVNFSAEFVVKANVNLTIGADFNYTTAKRYSATVRVFSFTGTSGTVSLPGDGNYRFTFYVMGTLGLRAGINLELKAGIGSVDLNSIGLSVEPGAYVNLWGYFYYQLQQLDGVETARSLGALYVEIGIYLESAVGAQLGDGLLSVSVPIYENTWPLYTAGEQQHAVDFAYSQDKAPKLNFASSASSSSVPQMLFTMSTFDLKTGEMDTRVYDRSRFDIQVDNANFRYNAAAGKIEVVDKDIQVSEGNLVLTWKGAPLSYSSDSLTRKIPLSWLARAGSYILQLDPQNGGATEIVAARYNGAISVTPPAYPGYTFDGWYTAASGGTKAAIPSYMPAEDLKLFAHWIANTNTPYKVQHYLIDPNTRTSTSPAVTETLTGTTGMEIQLTSDRFKDEGYTTGMVSGASIKGDGSTVVRMDYYPMNRTMTFDWGYAGATASTVTEPIGKTIGARIPAPTRAGYTFAGWSPEVPSAMPAADTTYTAMWTAREDTAYQVVYLLQDIGSDTYTVADTESYRGTTDTEAKLTNPTKSYAGFTFDDSVPGTVTAAPIAGNGTTILKLYFKRNNYAMTINYNGSGETTKVVNVPFGATMELYLGAPTWQGHAFTGWSPASQTTMPAQAVEFTAQWSLNNYTVSFNSNGGTEVADQAVGYGYKASEPAIPAKDDLVFGGWYSDSALTSAYDFATQVTADFTLYAKWLRSYTVTFDSSGGSTIDNQTVNEGAKAIAPIAPKLEGFVFSGWFHDSGLTSAYAFETEVVTANITLYAKWAEAPKNSYTVSFISNGGTEVADLTVEEGAVATAPSAPTLIGHTFEGWYTDSELTSTSSFNFSTTPVTGNLTLYANWTLNSYTVSFNSNGGSAVANQTVEYNGTATEPVAPERQGYVFSGWYRDLAGTDQYVFTSPVTANLTLYANWTATFTVSFDSYGGSSVASQTVEYNGTAAEPAAPTKVGHTFVGWYIDVDLKEAYSFATAVTANRTLYANWEQIIYTVGFDSKGGSAVNQQLVNYGGTAAEPAAPTRAGYMFGGWYADLTSDTAYNFTTQVTSSFTLYAKWTAMNTVSFISNGGSPVDDLMVENGAKAAAPADPTRTGYTFEGWYSDEGLKEAYSFSSPVTINLTLYAKWAMNSYTVSFISNGGSSVADQIVEHDGTVNKPVAPKRQDFMFGGWYSDSTFATVYDFTSRVTEDIVLYANWTASAWNQVGEAIDLNNISSDHRRGRLQLAVDSRGTLYATTTTSTVYEGEIIVAKFEGGEWKIIGDGSDFPPETRVGYHKLAIDSQDNPYVVYNNDSSGIAVKKYNGSTWEPLGNTGLEFDPSAVSIAFDILDTPYIVHIGKLGGNWRVGVVMYDIYEEEWVELSGGEELSNRSTMIYLPLRFDEDNNPLLLYHYNGDNWSGKADLVKYEDGAWSTVSSFSNVNELTTIFALDPHNVPYMAEYGSKLTVKKYNGSAWEPVGNSGFAEVFQELVPTVNGSIDFDSDGTPYVAYLDPTIGGGKVNVMKFDGNSWRSVGNAGISAGQAGSISHVIDKNGNIYVIYSDKLNQHKMTVMKYGQD